MNACFVDTSYFLALLIRSDLNHSAAHKWAAENKSAMITTEYVVLEVGNYLSPVSTRLFFTQFFNALRTDPAVEMVPASTELLERGATLYMAREDKSWSLVDCISFIVMEDRALHDALTADHHFDQAGFRAVLKFE